MLIEPTFLGCAFATWLSKTQHHRPTEMQDEARRYQVLICAFQLAGSFLEPCRQDEKSRSDGPDLASSPLKTSNTIRRRDHHGYSAASTPMRMMVWLTTGRAEASRGPEILQLTVARQEKTVTPWDWYPLAEACDDDPRTPHLGPFSNTIYPLHSPAAILGLCQRPLPANVPRGVLMALLQCSVDGRYFYPSSNPGSVSSCLRIAERSFQQNPPSACRFYMYSFDISCLNLSLRFDCFPRIRE